MSNEKVTQLPSVSNALAADIIYAVQGGVSVQETLQQVLNLALAQTILNHAGNPNGLVAGNVFQLLWDTTNLALWVCTTSGSSSSAVWTQVAPSNSTTINPAHGGTGVSNPTAHTIPIAEGSSNFNFLGPLTNGQLLIGSTGLDPVPGTISAGSGIIVTNNAGSIQISSSGSPGFGWNVVTGSTQAMDPQNGYIANDNSSLVTLTLPATAPVGATIIVMGMSADGWTIAQNSGQVIHLGSNDTTTGAGGSLSSTNQRDTITLICTVADTEFTALSVIGNLTVV